MKIIIKILIIALGLLVAAYIIPSITILNIYIALLAALILGALNVVVRPILVLFTLPVTVVTLGLFLFVINAGLFMLTAALISGFEVDGFIPALLGSLVVSVVGAIADTFID